MAAKKTDQFMLFLNRLVENLTQHYRAFAILLAFILGVGAAFSYWTSQKHRTSEEARASYYQAQKEIEAEKKKNGVSTQGKVDVDQAYSASIGKLTAVTTQFAGTRASYEAMLTLGDLYFNHQSPQKALPWYQKALQSAPDQLEKLLTSVSIASAYEDASQCALAIETLEKAARLGEDFMQGEMLLSIARCQETLSLPQKAKATYEQVISQHPGTAPAKLAEIYKSALKIP